MIFFSDAVFAIGITLLVLEIRIPEFQGDFRWEVLESVIPKFIACATSYAVIGISWWAHNRISQKLIDVDGRLMALNLLRLFFIAIIPFPTMMLMEHGGNPDSWVFYALTLGISSTTECLLWLYASAKPELVGTLEKRERLARGLKLMTTPVVFALSAIFAHVISFDSGWISLTIFLLVVEPMLGRIIARKLKVAKL